MSDQAAAAVPAASASNAVTPQSTVISSFTPSSRSFSSAGTLWPVGTSVRWEWRQRTTPNSNPTSITVPNRAVSNFVAVEAAATVARIERDPNRSESRDGQAWDYACIVLDRHHILHTSGAHLAWRE